MKPTEQACFSTKDFQESHVRNLSVGANAGETPDLSREWSPGKALRVGWENEWRSAQLRALMTILWSHSICGHVTRRTRSRSSLISSLVRAVALVTGGSCLSVEEVFNQNTLAVYFYIRVSFCAISSTSVCPRSHASYVQSALAFLSCFNLPQFPLYNLDCPGIHNIWTNFI